MHELGITQNIVALVAVHAKGAKVQRVSLVPLNSVVMIKNVGNLVCPALFDLGEQTKVVILSVTEGEDKPIALS